MPRLSKLAQLIPPIRQQPTLLNNQLLTDVLLTSITLHQVRDGRDFLSLLIFFCDLSGHRADFFVECDTLTVGYVLKVFCNKMMMMFKGNK